MEVDWLHSVPVAGHLCCPGTQCAERGYHNSSFELSDMPLCAFSYFLQKHILLAITINNREENNFPCFIKKRSVNFMCFMNFITESPANLYDYCIVNKHCWL